MCLNKYSALLSLVLLLVSCNGNINSSSIANRENDTSKNGTLNLPDGLMKYYDSNNKLANMTKYNLGKREGSCTNYYSNGKVSDSGFYHCDLAEGNWVFFDTLGNKIYTNYFYHNLEYGPQLWYKNNKLFKYEFLSFDKETIASIVLNENGGIDSVLLFEMGIHILKKNEQNLNLFAYLPKIPGMYQHFALGIKNKSNTKELNTIVGNDFLIDTLLVPPPEGWNYYISCHIQDRTKSYNKIFVEQLIRSSK